MLSTIIPHAYAAGTVSGNSLGGLPAVTPASGDVFSVILSWLEPALLIFGIIAFVYVLYAGFMYMTAGSGENTENAKKVIINALIGLIIISLSYVIVKFATGFIGNLKDAPAGGVTDPAAAGKMLNE